MNEPITGYGLCNQLREAVAKALGVCEGPLIDWSKKPGPLSLGELCKANAEVQELFYRLKWAEVDRTAVPQADGHA